jgi:glycosyltransferase involved in cell wall biosynthesis
MGSHRSADGGRVPGDRVTAPEVAVNLLWCVPGEVGGSEEYLVRQLLGLAEVVPADWRPRVFALPGFAAAHPDLAALMPIETAPFGGSHRVRRIAGEIGWLRRRTGGAALTHHGGGTAPLGASRPFVLTVHDLQYRTFPQHFSAAKRRYLSWMIPNGVHRAGVVTVPSEYVRRSVVEAFGADPSRVVVVPHGIEPTLAADVTGEAELRRRYALGDGPVIVYPAITHTHKNHRFLLELLQREWTDPALRLVLTGGVGDAEGDVSASSERRVCRLGRVPAADRNGLLAMATALVFPSLYEGFGAPLIEAMAMGTPIIAGDVTCIPDVVGDAGIVLPLSIEAWGPSLQQAVARHDELAAAGLARVGGFTAAASGRALATAYALAVGR